jgi:hypothetical protein
MDMSGWNPVRGVHLAPGRLLFLGLTALSRIVPDLAACHQSSRD